MPIFSSVVDERWGGGAEEGLGKLLSKGEQEKKWPYTCPSSKRKSTVSVKILKNTSDKSEHRKDRIVCGAHGDMTESILSEG